MESAEEIISAELKNKPSQWLYVRHLPHRVLAKMKLQKKTWFNLLSSDNA